MRKGGSSARSWEGSLSQEELGVKRQESAGLMPDLLEMSNAESFVDTTLERNEIKIGEEVGGRLDDPIIRIFADEVENDESKLARTITVFTVEPRAEVYVDEFSALFSEDIEDEFKDEYDDEEYTCLVFLGKLISELIEPSSGKIDMETFSERCEFRSWVNIAENHCPNQVLRVDFPVNIHLDTC